jgi:hypothetical protein
MERSNAGIAAPREDQASGAAGADDLVVDQIGGHANECQFAAALADDFVCRGERDQMREALHRDNVAVADGLLDGILQRTKVTQRILPWMLRLELRSRDAHLTA